MTNLMKKHPVVFYVVVIWLAFGVYRVWKTGAPLTGTYINPVGGSLPPGTKGPNYTRVAIGTVLQGPLYLLAF